MLGGPELQGNGLAARAGLSYSAGDVPIADAVTDSEASRTSVKQQHAHDGQEVVCLA